MKDFTELSTFEVEVERVVSGREHFNTRMTAIFAVESVMLSLVEEYALKYFTEKIAENQPIEANRGNLRIRSIRLRGENVICKTGWHGPDPTK